MYLPALLSYCFHVTVFNPLKVVSLNYRIHLGQLKNLFREIWLMLHSHPSQGQRCQMQHRKHKPTNQTQKANIKQWLVSNFWIGRYFRKGAEYGLACFENMPVESEIERGARMKSVGILATSYTLLYRHMQFLETQVRYCRSDFRLQNHKSVYLKLSQYSPWFTNEL